MKIICGIVKIFFYQQVFENFAIMLISSLVIFSIFVGAIGIKMIDFTKANHSERKVCSENFVCSIDKVLLLQHKMAEVSYI